jgi:hypothetical protein
MDFLLRDCLILGGYPKDDVNYYVNGVVRFHIPSETSLQVRQPSPTMFIAAINIADDEKAPP